MDVEEANRSSRPRTRRKVGGPMLWFAVLGGIAAWALHILVAWSFLEVACLTPGRTTTLQFGGVPGLTASLVAYVATGLPWLTSLLAFLTCLRLRSRLSREGEDILSGERTNLLLVMGIFLDLFALAALTGSAIGLFVLEPCS
jgi:hypothetical protein